MPPSRQQAGGTIADTVGETNRIVTAKKAQIALRMSERLTIRVKNNLGVGSKVNKKVCFSQFCQMGVGLK